MVVCCFSGRGRSLIFVKAIPVFNNTSVRGSGFVSLAPFLAHFILNIMIQLFREKKNQSCCLLFHLKFMEIKKPGQLKAMVQSSHPHEVPRSEDRTVVIPYLCKEPEDMNDAYF